MQDTTLHLNFMSPQALLGYHSFLHLVFLMSLINLRKTAQICCRLSFNMGIIDCPSICLHFDGFFSWSELSYGLLEEDYRGEVSFPLDHIKDTHGLIIVTPVDVGLDYLVEYCLSGFSTVITLLLFPFCPLWAEVPYSPRTSRLESYISPSQGGSMCINYLEFFCPGNMSILSHYLLIQAFTCISIDM